MKNTNLLFATLGLVIFAGIFALIYSQHIHEPNRFVSTVIPDEEYPAPATKAVAIPAEVSSSDAVSLYAKLDNPFYYVEGDQEYIYYYVNARGGVAENLEKAPLNISLVIDKSGSMGSENKLGYVKEAAKLVLQQMSPQDKVSVIAYDSEVYNLGVANDAETHFEQIRVLQNAVAALQTGSSTYLSGGMQEGYKQTLEHYNNRYVNRVLLLSDGKANQGIRDVNTLQKMVKNHYQQEGIAISTFGVGSGYNEDLMTNLAEHGKGNYYFIGNSKEIPNIFEEELNGLLSVIAQNVKLHISYPTTHLELEQVYGYNYTNNNGDLTVDFNDVFSNEEKAVLIKFKVKEKINAPLAFTSAISFENVLHDNTPETLSVDNTLQPTADEAQYLASMDEEVIQNVTVFHSNELMELATKEFDNGNYDQAVSYLEMNDDYLIRQQRIVSPDSAMLRSVISNGEYLEQVKNAENMSATEKNMMQKSSKDYIYRSNKKKIK